MPNFTPAPWWIHEYKDDEGRTVVLTGECADMGIITIEGYDEEMEKANAKLIAAAPDLYEACKEFVRKCENGQAKSVRSYAQMKAAIEKVEGGKQCVMQSMI